MANLVQDSNDKLIHGVGKTTKALSTLIVEVKATLIAVELAASLGFKNCIFKMNLLLVYSPPPNYVMFNGDGACDSFFGVVGLADLVQDSNDKLIHGVGKITKDLLTLVAEAEAILIAVELATSLGFKNCIFEMNSLLLYPLPPNYVKFNSDAACDFFLGVVSLAVLV